MKQLLALTLAAGIGFGGGAVFVGSRADAQGAPTPPPPPGMAGDRGPDGARADMMSPGMMRPGMMGGRMMHRGDYMRRMRQFTLIYPAADRALSGPDVQKIAEAFLLFNGNHTWKVTEVTEEPNRVTFALATPDGTAIAHFAMDRHTARPERLN